MTWGPRRRRGSVAIAVILAVTGGCSEAPRPTTDLMRWLPFANVQTAERELLFAATVERDGWDRIETVSGEAPFRWAVGERASARFLHVGAGPATLHLDLRALVPPGGSPQRVGVRLNGVDVGAVTAGGDWTSPTLELPAPPLIAGDNQLELRFARHTSPAEAAFLEGGGFSAGTHPADKTGNDDADSS